MNKVIKICLWGLRGNYPKTLAAFLFLDYLAYCLNYIVFLLSYHQYFQFQVLPLFLPCTILPLFPLQNQLDEHLLMIFQNITFMFREICIATACELCIWNVINFMLLVIVTTFTFFYFIQIEYYFTVSNNW